MNRTLSNLFHVSAAARALAVAAMLAGLAACAGGGPDTVVNQLSTPPTNSADNYTGPPPANADVQAFKLAFWANVTPTNRCGGCHHAGGQSPQFARTDDVNLAYQAALPLVNLTNPSQSTFVLKVGGGHNCWVADPSACAATMLVWIQGWIGAGSSSTTSVTLVAPPVQSAGGGKQFPASASAGNPSFANTVYPLLTQFCSGCHTPSSATAQQPYFADKNDVNAAYLAAQPKMNLAQPNQSRFYERLGTEFHHCWVTPQSNGAPDCPGSAAAMLAAITAFANGIQVTPIDPNLVVSNAVTLQQGTIAAGGSRYEANLVAKYMFETGTGSTAYDTSGVTPAADLSLSGNVTWAGGWGITLGAGGKAQASTSSSQKFANMIQGSGEYTIETWVAPADVTQTNAYIVSYSGSNTTRDMTLGQAATQYAGYARSSTTDTNGMPPLMTTTTDGAAQAALQHVVLTYDPVNGQKIYVNGIYTGDADPSKGGSLANWDSTFALVLGNETTGQRQWKGTIKFAAIHNRALTAPQIQQNFAAGVGQKYFLLFGVSQLTGVPQSYILFQGSQYDTFSYLFAQPKFISLDPNATIPANLKLSGMRIGVNGALAPAGQSFTTINATIGGSNYTPGNGQLLSNIGTVVPATLGPANDLFFLSFDQLGSHVHAYTEPPVTIPVPVPTTTPQPDFGVTTFERALHSMAKITGVPFTNPTVFALYSGAQQSMPSTPLISAFVASEQTSLGQLANAYCGQLLANASYRTAFFGSGLEGSLTGSAASFFSSASNRQIVETALVKNAVGTGVSPAAATAVTNEVDALLRRFYQNVSVTGGVEAQLPATTVSAASQAACAAVLGSAAVTLQ
ncbi:MAG TPA: LamG domain-containing protein [Steroidobacteraceae bacterium]|nr:LamG domain-containing protein [Steroidobacteraceae bacterium]